MPLLNLNRHLLLRGTSKVTNPSFRLSVTAPLLTQRACFSYREYFSKDQPYDVHDVRIYFKFGNNGGNYYGGSWTGHPEDMKRRSAQPPSYDSGNHAFDPPEMWQTSEPWINQPVRQQNSRMVLNHCVLLPKQQALTDADKWGQFAFITETDRYPPTTRIEGGNKLTSGGPSRAESKPKGKQKMYGDEDAKAASNEASSSAAAESDSSSSLSGGLAGMKSWFSGGEKAEPEAAKEEKKKK